MSEFLRMEKFTGWHMLAIMVAFFGVIVSVNLTLAWYANSSWTGLVVKNSYVASQKFNDKQAERRRQIALGWKAGIEYQEGVLAVQLEDADGKPVVLNVLEARVGRPAFESEDRAVVFVPSGGGIYRAETQLSSGIWRAELKTADTPEKTWEHAIRFVVPDVK
ncbi:FixH family protein [Salaquimonas pukyongi]|uniref:FixH family protein n=1 Tax=Salaquimonas pukyongi TaxID=2712698 RepID=UPI00096B7177|nr:FixH family protein [Salaquimonas pukyongi]